MDYIIDIQGFIDAEKKFIPKEVAVVSLQGRVIDHWIIKPPVIFSALPSIVKETNDFCSTEIHGLQWFEGDIDLQQLRYHLHEIAKNASRIYVHGSEKATFIETAMEHRVINIAEYHAPTFRKLQQIFKISHTCSTHGSSKFAYKKEFCALYKAHLLRMWFYDNLPEELKSTNTVNSEQFYKSLLKFQLVPIQIRYRDLCGVGNSGKDVCDCSVKEVTKNNEESSSQNSESYTTAENEHSADKKSA